MQVICHGAQVYGDEAEGPPVEDQANRRQAASETPRPGPLRITLARSQDQGQDMQRLREVFAVLQQFPGDEKVVISLANGGEVVDLDLPSLTTGYCPALCQALAEVVGKNGAVAK